MAEAAYEVLNYAARYWFVGLAVLIVALAVRDTLREQKLQKNIRQRIDRARLTAVLTLTRGNGRHLTVGEQWRVSQKGFAGRGFGCDLRLRHKSVAGRHARLIPEEDCLRVIAVGDAQVSIDGRKLKGEGLILGDGELRLGDLVFTVRCGGDEDEETT